MIDVSGVGDEAIWCASVGLLYFNHRGRAMWVSLNLLDAGEDREVDVAVDIARAAVAGL